MTDKKDILFDAFPKQIEFLEAVVSGKYRLIVYGGAIRGGKTYAGLGALIILCKMYPKSRWAVVRTDLMTLKRNTIQSWNKIKPVNFIKNYNQDTQTITFNNGSQILFFAENYSEDKELERWKGLEVNGFLLEEMPEIQLKSFYKAFERSGSHIIPNCIKQPPPLIIGTCNPSNNWVKEHVYDKWKENKLPDTWLYIPSKLFDNPYVASNKEYLDSLRFMPRYEYEVFVEGNWDMQKRSGAEFYKEFNLDKHVCEVKYNPSLAIWISIDENVNPYFPASLWQFDGKKAYCFDEVALKNPNNTTRAFGQEIDRKLKELSHKQPVFLTGDSTSKKEDVKIEKGMNLFKLIQNELTEWKPQIRFQTNPSVVARQQFINTVFYNQTRGEPYNRLEIFIGTNCKYTKEDLLNVKESPKEKGGKHKEIFTDADSGISSQKWGHHSDTLDYAFCYVYNEDYLFYQRGSKPFENVMLGEKAHKADEFTGNMGGNW